MYPSTYTYEYLHTHVNHNCLPGVYLSLSLQHKKKGYLWVGGVCMYIYVHIDLNIDVDIDVCRYT